MKLGFMSHFHSLARMFASHSKADLPLLEKLALGDVG